MKNLASLGSLLVLLFIAGCCVATNFGDAQRDFIRSSGDVVLVRSLRSPRLVSLDNRTNCGAGDPEPVNRVDTTTRVAALISELESRSYAAYIITTGDEHQSEYPPRSPSSLGVINAVSSTSQSEYPPDHDRRREYISGFSGSAGTAVVLTTGERALWTDGRYYLQADDQLDCQWLLMKETLEGYPDILEFLLDNLGSGDVVSADAKLIGYGSWNELSEGLAGNGITIESSDENLVDVVWTADAENEQPAYSTAPAIVYPIQYAGVTYSEKLTEVRAVLAEQGAGALVVTALDEVAWLYNIRGEDVVYNPVLRAYAIVTATTAALYTDKTKILDDVNEHLSDIAINDYDQVWLDLAALSNDASISKIFLPGDDRAPGCSFAIYSTVEETKRLVETTPTLISKAKKNEIEISEMRKAIITDGVALSRFLAFLEGEVRG
ncbi:Creatinase N-terminal [Trinorchestia longiramus]|nr:Creatinase N-terminal [Trinorchestia longiramus]